MTDTTSYIDMLRKFGSDLGLPKLNGYEAAKRIREQPRDEQITIIAMTGWGQEKDVQMALEAGFDYHLTKPVEPAALTSLLERIAESPGDQPKKPR